MTKRIGFACKYMHPDQTQKKKLLEEIQRPLNTRSTTVAWLNRQTKEVAEERLWDIMVHNIKSYYNLIEYVGGLPNELRMVRLEVTSYLFILSLLGLTSGVSLMYDNIARATLLTSAQRLVNLMLGCLCILVSLLYLRQIILIL